MCLSLLGRSYSRGDGDGDDDDDDGGGGEECQQMCSKGLDMIVYC